MAAKPFQPRAASRKRIFWPIVLIVFGIVAVLAGFFYFLFVSDFFRVREISLNGNHLISDSDLKSAMIGLLSDNAFFWRGLFGADHIFFWRQPEIAGLDSRLPLASAVRVAVDWRSRSVSISVEERSVAGIWCGSAGGCFVFDRTGFIFASAPAASGSLILRVVDENPNFGIGRYFLASAGQREDFFRVVGELEKSGLKADSAVIGRETDQEWRIRLAAGPDLRLSWNLPDSELLASLAEKIKTLPLKDLEYIDLTVPNRLYYQ